MEQFGVNRETATWPGSIGTAFSHLAAIFVALFQRKVSLFTIFLLGALFIWSGIVASAFVPTMAWMTVTFGVIQGLGSGVISLTYSILLAMYFDKYRGLTSGLKFAGGSLGGLVFPKFLPYLQNEYGFRVIAMSYATLRVHIILLCLSVYLVYGCLQPMISVLMADYIGVQWISTCYGLSGLFLLPLTLCSPSITGFFRDFHGSYDGLYMLHGGMQLAASALFLAVVCVERRNRKTWTLSDTT
ncbi:monocarboxylate transporter 12 [Ixodes scapularis]